MDAPQCLILMKDLEVLIEVTQSPVTPFDITDAPCCSCVRRITSDRYGRTVAELFIDGSNIQQQLVATGHADISWKYVHQCA